jgi:hypothetical protein
LIAEYYYTQSNFSLWRNSTEVIMMSLERLVPLLKNGAIADDWGMKAWAGNMKRFR